MKTVEKYDETETDFTKPQVSRTIDIPEKKIIVKRSSSIGKLDRYRRNRKMKGDKGKRKRNNSNKECLSASLLSLAELLPTENSKWMLDWTWLIVVWIGPIKSPKKGHTNTKRESNKVNRTFNLMAEIDALIKSPEAKKIVPTFQIVDSLVPSKIGKSPVILPANQVAIKSNALRYAQKGKF